MLTVNDLNTAQIEFLSELISDTYFEPFTMERQIGIVKDAVKKEYELEFEFNESSFEEFFKKLELRHCENCGKVESLYNGGGTIDEMDCCVDCYEEKANELEEEE